jgi:hypothetical protein
VVLVLMLALLSWWMSARVELSSGSGELFAKVMSSSLFAKATSVVEME